MFDKTAVMGCRSAPYICQPFTNVIRHIMRQLTYIIYNYVDDFMSLDYQRRAWQSYHALGNLLRDLGVNEAEDKAVEPAQCIEFLGVLYDLVNMTISLPQDKLQELMDQLQRYIKQKFYTKKQLQQITRRLQFVTGCVCAG